MGSNTWKRPRAKMSSRPQGTGNVGERSERRSVVQPASHRAPIRIELKLMPGAEPWMRVTRDGVTCCRPATMAVWELILWLNGWHTETQ